MVLDNAFCKNNFFFKMYLLLGGVGGGGGGALFISGIEVQYVSVSEHVWVGGSGLRGGVGLPAGGIRASQGTFSSFVLDQLQVLGQLYWTEAGGQYS